MSLMLWEPLRQMDVFDRLVDDMFGRHTNGRTTFRPDRAWRPAADLVADEAGYRFHFDLPGVAKDDIEIDVSDGVLTVRGKRKDVIEKEDEAHTYRREAVPA